VDEVKVVMASYDVSMSVEEEGSEAANVIYEKVIRALECRFTSPSALTPRMRDDSTRLYKRRFVWTTLPSRGHR
jgi:hypothetical protein